MAAASETAVLKKRPLTRDELTLEATWQIDSMLIFLQQQIADCLDTDDRMGLYGARSLLCRIEELNSAVMSVLGGDDLFAERELAQAVTGKRIPLTPAH